MEKKLLSSLSNPKTLPQDYTLPPDQRPGEDHIAPFCTTIPVIDLHKAKSDNPADLIQQILQACQDFGFFQVINHDVSVSLIDDTTKVIKEFIDLPNEDKAHLFSEDNQKPCRIFTSVEYGSEKVHYWRDNLRHSCYPLDKYIDFWPHKPSRYRDVVGSFLMEVRSMLMQILELISQGLGLEVNYFEELAQLQIFSVNHYPPCPEPSLALGLPKHCDPNIITAIHQGEITGLQIFKDGQWIGVEAIPNAFVVNLGFQMQIASNGKLKSSQHRVVTNSSRARISMVTFINPDGNSIIQPASTLVDEGNPPLYRAVKYSDFMIKYKSDFGDPGLFESFKFQP